MKSDFWGVKEGVLIHKRLNIFTDGGARGNPGRSAIACLIFSEKGQVLIAKSRYIGLRTNNQAEYEALIMALKSAVELGGEEITCHLDSQLVVKQLNGEYAVRNIELQKLWKKVYELRKGFKRASFVSVPRNNFNIKKADKLVNETLDKETTIGSF